MELHELHVCDGNAGAPCHCYPVASRDRGVGGVEINFPASARGQHDAVASDRLDVAGFFIERVKTKTTIFRRESKFRGRDQIDRSMIFQQLHFLRSAQRGQELVFDLAPGHVLHMQHSPLRVSALAAKVELAMTGKVTFIEMHADVHQLANCFRPFRHDGAHDFFVAKPGAGFERIAYVQLKRIFIARHTGDPSLRPCRVAVGPFAFRDHCHRTVLRRFQGKAQTCDPAPDHHEIEFLHFSRRLSISRVLPMKTASAMTAFGRKVSRGCKLSASTMLM